jgi:hypothetical protein
MTGRQTGIIKQIGITEYQRRWKQANKAKTEQYKQNEPFVLSKIDGEDLNTHLENIRVEARQLVNKISSINDKVENKRASLNRKAAEFEQKQGKRNRKTLGVIDAINQKQFDHLVTRPNNFSNHTLKNMIKILKTEDRLDAVHLRSLAGLPIFPNDYEHENALHKYYKVRSLIYQKENRLLRLVLRKALSEIGYSKDELKQ